ncbi:hypothetical protein HN51_057849 [Arachis hypogaea]|uniref:transcriptional corepressor LEUNIG_HOMOLOG isoform X1 n=1 Tax=Arachis hypogaea TaxID=3818 RepID=UPI000DED5A49|nr:uncharacterized protein LOC112782787 isoform X1 [Arachis hypogaea]
MDFNWDAEHIFRLYVHDYMVKRGMHKTAEIFRKECNLTDTAVTLDSHDGFLLEWWSVFYEIYMSRARLAKDQATGAESSGKVPGTTCNAGISVPPIPRSSMSEQRPDQRQVNARYNRMMAQPAACVLQSTLNAKEHPGYMTVDAARANNLKLAVTNSNNSLQDVGNNAQREAFKDICIGRDVSRDPLDVAQRTLQHKPNTGESFNRMPINGWPVNNQVLTSFLRAPNYQQQFQAQTMQNPEAIPADVRAGSPKSQSFPVPGNSVECNNHHTKVSEAELSIKDKQTMDPMIRDQQPQMQSQNVEVVPVPHQKSKKRKATIPLRTGESAMDCVDAEDGKPMDESVESFLSFENEHADHRVVPFSNLTRISAAHGKNENKGFSFEEVSCLHSSKNKVLSTHFSWDGKVLASAGHEKKVFIWNMETLNCVTTTEGHSHLITDVRFRPSSTIFATSSFDRSIKLWDAARPDKSLFQLDGHADQVMSLDFHPRKPAILCSCDSNDIIRLWDINQRTCLHTTKGGANKQVRFQPRTGKFLAAVSGNNIKIVDFESNRFLYHLKGHVKDVLSICWDMSGNYVASVSEDCARVWSVADGKCISELNSTGNKFQSCVFHPGYHNLLVIGGYESLELWCTTESSKTLTVPAHKGLIAGLAHSPQDEMIASASHDHCVKLWK